MAVKLNLLPSDYAVSGSVATLLKIVRPLNVVLLAIFLAGALGMAGFFIFSSVTLKNLNTSNNNLKAQIQSQQAAQQQVVLLKDRLGKIKRVQEIPGSYKSLAAVAPLISGLSDNTVVSEFDVNSQKTSISLAFKTNSDLTGFISSLQTQSYFSGVTLDSFSYNPASGYLVGFSFTRKN